MSGIFIWLLIIPKVTEACCKAQCNAVRFEEG